MSAPHGWQSPQPARERARILRAELHRLLVEYGRADLYQNACDIRDLAAELVEVEDDAAEELLVLATEAAPRLSVKQLQEVAEPVLGDDPQ
jgi:hypothetical protein